MSKERLQKIQSKGILRPEIMVIKEETTPYLSIGAFLAGPAWGWEAAQNRQKKIIDLKQMEEDNRLY